jgi:DNA-binding transcriptional regulator YiaG
MTRITRNRKRVRHQHQPATHHGAVAGAVLRTARRSANASTSTIATALGVTRNTVLAWENGSSPVASLAAPDLERL